MTKFYTRQGDKGRSALGSKKFGKDDPVFAALGDFDELNSWLGVCRTITGKRLKKIERFLKEIQEYLFIVQAEIASVGMNYKPRIKIKAAKTEEIEKIIAEIDKQLPDIKNFVIAGGSQLSANLDYGRALARRAERSIIGCSENKFRPELLRFANRLSSVLFALARYVNYQLKIKEDKPTYR